MPAGWSWLFGHLLVIGKYAKRLPSDVNVFYVIDDVEREVGSSTFLMDLWPMSTPMLFVGDLDAAAAVTTQHNLPKGIFMQKGMHRITGGPDILSMNGPEWKFWRSMFNPGFSKASMKAQVGTIVDSVELYCQNLQERAGGGLFLLGDLTAKLTMDVIVKITL